MANNCHKSPEMLMLKKPDATALDAEDAEAQRTQRKTMKKISAISAPLRSLR
jgi:hypothetical protein